MSRTTALVPVLVALCIFCGLARADTKELRIAQQYGFSYLQLITCSTMG